MENKQKPSLVRLVPSHHSFHRPGFILTEDMLSWSFLQSGNQPGSSLDMRLDQIFKTVLSALMSIDTFETKVSLGVDKKNKKFVYARKTWARIYLEGKHVLSINHHSHNHNQQFCSLVDWAELEVDSCANVKESTDRVYGVLLTWTVPTWRSFFRQKLLDRAEHLKNKAKQKRLGTQTLCERGDSIIFSLAKGALNF